MQKHQVVPGKFQKNFELDYIILVTEYYIIAIYGIVFHKLCLQNLLPTATTQTLVVQQFAKKENNQ